MFVRGSRYESVTEAIYVAPDGREIRYKRLRFIPDARALQTYRVAQQDRLDLIAFRFYQDPEQFWRITDSNGAFVPDDLTRETGRRLIIPLAER
jgi:hypothetical protein